MEFQSILLCALVLSFASCQYQLDGGQSRAIADYQDDGKHKASNVTVCPEDYSPHDDCVTLDQLMSGNFNKSHTTFKFKPATFELSSVIRFEHVSNISLEPASAYKVDITCVGNNTGFIFYNVSGLTVQNMVFSGCMAYMFYYEGDWYKADLYDIIFVLESSDIMFKNLTFGHGLGGGITAINVYGYFTIMDSLFTYLQGTGLSLKVGRSVVHYNDHRYTSLRTFTITNSQFDNHYHSVPEGYVAGGIAYALNMSTGVGLPTTILLENITITNNTHRSDSSGIYIDDSGGLNMTMKGVNFANNLVIGDLVPDSDYSAQADFLYQTIDSFHYSYISIIDSNFINNGFNNSSPVVDIEDSLYGVILFTVRVAVISIRNTTIANNTGLYDAAILVNPIVGGDPRLLDNLNYLLTRLERLNILLETSIIANNSIFVPDYYEKGAVQLNRVGNITVSNCSFVNNSATGLLISNSHVVFSGCNTIRGNRGYYGGGMALNTGLTLELLAETTLRFEDNFAEGKGGGLFVQDFYTLHTVLNGNTVCFFSLAYLKVDSISLHFSNNSAVIAGSDWYGGNLYCCEHTPVPNCDIGWKLITAITDFSVDYKMDLTSNPLHVCDCSTENSQDCINFSQTVQTIHTYPGKLFNLSLLAVGQLLNISTLSGVPNAIYAGLLPLHNKSGSIPDSMRVQNGARRCSNLTYRVSSSNANETMVLTVVDEMDKIPEYFVTFQQKNSTQWEDTVLKLLLRRQAIPAYVSIYLQPCPVGFELSEYSNCVCSSSLTKFVIGCSIDTMLINRKSPVWLSAVNNTRAHEEDRSVFVVYLIHQHCPFDYCVSGEFNFSLADPDAQCNNNRSGILCGKCKSGYSLTLGTNDCKQCSNLYLLLLVPFALAGVLLIVFLSLTDMTVTAGTINGLLFFANIVRENQATFFPAQTAETFLSVFIAWLNLDLGISSCFYDGLDAHALTFLQLSFPIYLWLLAFGVIIASRHFAFMNKLCGRNIVHVLATLCLLSYTKIQRTIAAGLSFTIVDMSNGTKYIAWLSDGNVQYLEGKHIPLFLVSVLFLLALFIPYTLSITFGPWLQSKTQYRVFCWVLKLKPFFDAYFGPLKDKHRYWTGVLLLSRLVLSLISSIIVLGNDSVNLLTINTLAFILLALLWQSGGVYKNWPASVLDCFFLINLGVLSLVTLYNKANAGGQYATVCVSVGSVFAMFCLILLYHCLKKLGLLAVICKRNLARAPLLEEVGNREEDSDDDLLNIIDEGRISDPMLRASKNPKPYDPDTY